MSEVVTAKSYGYASIRLVPPVGVRDDAVVGLASGCGAHSAVAQLDRPPLLPAHTHAQAQARHLPGPCLRVHSFQQQGEAPAILAADAHGTSAIARLLLLLPLPAVPLLTEWRNAHSSLLFLDPL